MSYTKLVKSFVALFLLMTMSMLSYAQNKTISGKVTNAKGEPIPSASVNVPGTTLGTTTDINGNFSISVPTGRNSVIISSVGFGTKTVTINASNDASVTLDESSSSLNEVVVIGYGTARKRDLTGAVSRVSEKDFNQGIQTAADQLIQGKAAGVQVLNNSGQPGGQTSIRIRGSSSVRTGNSPLIVVDGVPLSNNSARAGLSVPGGIGSTPDANGLNFINPNDIETMDILKDASATAIYGSRGANGVILVTTKKGKAGVPRVELTASAGMSNILKKLPILSGADYRRAITAYGVDPAKSDWGSNVDALDEVTRTAIYQNYTAAISGGNENGRYRASFGYLDQEGIVLKSGLKRLTANLSGGFKFLESKKLGLDLNVITSQTKEDIAPVATNSGFEGSLIGQALQWNPTRALRNSDGTLNLTQGGSDFPNTNYNPLATSESYNDNNKSTSILASLTPYFKFSPSLEYRMILSTSYATGIRRAQIANWTTIVGLQGQGWAEMANIENSNMQMSHFLNFNKQITTALYLSATAGYEYLKMLNKGSGVNARGFTANSIPYTNYFGGTPISQRGVWSWADPTTELQSYFVRGNFNLYDRYILSATFRADGSSKFGENNKYGYFPAFAFAWNIANEAFFNKSTLSNLKLRLGYGQTGNQEFPAGAAQERFSYTGPGQIALVNVANPDLKWETSAMYNAGLDFTIGDNKLNGTVEYFYKDTKDLLFQFDAIAPAPSARYWINLPGNVINKGFEVSLNSDVYRADKFNLNLAANASFLENRLKNYTGPTLLTGEISGQGLSGARSQQFVNDQPLNVFYIGRYLGLDKANGKALYEGGDANANRFYVGDPNPNTVVGFTATAGYDKLSLTANLNGAFGHYIYNNTVQAALAIGNIGNNKNFAMSVFDPNNMEDKSNSQPVSTRYLEKGDYVKLANVTLGYRLGDIGKSIKGANLFLTGQNLAVFTNYSGFDPEVNTPKPVDGVPSFGIEYTPYPSARSFVFGVNFSL